MSFVRVNRARGAFRPAFPSLTLRRGAAWFTNPLFADLAAIADFNNDRYALPALGPELIVNGGFDSDTVWVKGAGWTISGGALSKSPGAATLVKDTDVTRFTAGNTYQVQLTVSSRTAGFFSMYLRGLAFGTAGVSNGTFTFNVTAGVNTNEGLSILSDVNFDGSIDNVSIREVLLTRGGQALGVNLVTNGDFTTDTSGWAASGSGDLTFSSVSNALNMVRGAGGNAGLPQQTVNGLTIGSRYRLMFTTSINPVAFQVTGGAIPINAVSSGSVGFKSYEFIATATSHTVAFWPNSPSTTAAVDAVELRALPATGAYQKRSATFAEWMAYTAASTTARAYVAADGTWKNDLAADAPRFDFRNGKRQLRLEDARTNTIRNNSMAGAVVGVIGSGGALPTNWAGSSSGLTRTVVGTGTAYGLPYVDIRFNGTTSGTSAQVYAENGGVIAAANGQTWAASYPAIELVSGSLTNVSSVGFGYNIFDGAAAYITTPASAALGTLPAANSGRVRREASATIASASTATVAPFLSFNFSSGVTVDFTVRIFAPQLEQGSFASDPILTTSAAVTRAIETARFSPLLEAVLQRAAGSVVVRGIMTRPSGNARLVGLSTNRTLLNIPSSGQLQAYDGTNVVTKSDAPVNWSLSPFGADAGFDSSGLSLTVNGGTPASGAYSASVSDRSTFYLARPGTILPNDVYADGLYDFVGISPERLNDNVLQTLAVAA